MARTGRNHDRMGESAVIIWVYCYKTDNLTNFQALKWAEKHRELSIDFKATIGCVFGSCRDIILHFEEFDGF